MPAVPPTTASLAAGKLPGAASDEQQVVPLFEFVREDVVYDARWSPHKPGVFALVDGAGNVEVWDLIFDTEVPAASATPEPNKIKAAALGGVGYAAKSLNRVVWEEKEGKRLAVGGAAGVASVFEVGTDLAGEGARGEEWVGVKRFLGRVEAGRRG